jgi:hypothetical protein
MAAVVGICAQYNVPRALDHRFFLMARGLGRFTLVLQDAVSGLGHLPVLSVASGRSVYLTSGHSDNQLCTVSSCQQQAKALS